MTKIAIRCLALSLAVLLLPCRADDPKDKPSSKLIGTWKCISAKYDGKEVKRPEGYTQLKHVTPTSFMWAIYDGDGKLAAALGGSYKLKGDEYVETPEYGTGDGLENLKGKAQEFKLKVDGNKWHHTGMLSSGLTIEEVWERVTKKDD